MKVVPTGIWPHFGQSGWPWGISASLGTPRSSSRGLLSLAIDFPNSGERSASDKPARAPTSECYGGPSCRRSSSWPLGSGRCGTSRAFLKPRSWCSCPKPHRRSFFQAVGKGPGTNSSLGGGPVFSRRCSGGERGSSMSPFLRLRWRTAAWLANAEPVVGQALPLHLWTFCSNHSGWRCSWCVRISVLLIRDARLLSGVGVGREVGGPAS